MKLSLDGDSLINHLPWLSGPRFGNHLLHLPPLSTPLLLLLLPLGVIPSLHRCAQKRERSRSAVDAGEPIEQEDAHGERNALWKKKKKKKTSLQWRHKNQQARRFVSVRSAVRVRGEEQKKHGAPVHPPASAAPGGDTQRRKDSPKRSEGAG